VATPWREDRRQREKNFTPLRRVLDACLVRPVAARVERAVIRAGTLVALSEYTRRGLDRIAGRSVVHGILRHPIERSLFSRDGARVVPGRVGFTGRLNDPRKNVSLFLEAVGLCRQRGLPVTGVLIGGELLPAAREGLERLGLQGAVEVHPHVPRPSLPSFLQTLDAYVVPSKQEGLCIAALEAMACGCPVVSTRCGGPEEFVADGETGYLTGFDAVEMANAIEKIFRDRPLRDKLSLGAERVIDTQYGEESSKAIFWRAFDAAFAGKAHGHDTRHG
jgi:glycosyltransferase involved in cell wall biosynthesis